MLTVPVSVAAALEADAMQFAWMVAFPTMPDATKATTGIYLTDFERDISYGGNTYVSEGDLLRLPGVVRDRGIRLQDYKFTLEGASQRNAARFAYQNMTGQPCDIMVALLNESGSMIGGAPINLYRGTFHTWQERESRSSSTIEVVLTSPWSKPSLTAGRITSDYHQKERHPDDEFFRYAHRERKNIGWGAED